jgi:hypothetical protein
MRPTWVVTGTLTDGKTLTLDEVVPLEPGRVRVVIEQLPPEPTHPPQPLQEFLEQIWERQRQRGHVPPTPEEVEAWMRESRGDREP